MVRGGGARGVSIADVARDPVAYDGRQVMLRGAVAGTPTCAAMPAGQDASASASASAMAGS